MSARPTVRSIFLVSLLLASCRRDAPDTCRTNSECASGHCNLATYYCEPRSDGGIDQAADHLGDTGTAGTAGTAPDGGGGGEGGRINADGGGKDADAKVGCAANGCSDASAMVCDPDSATCVQCLGNLHCAAPKPVCDTGPKVCVECTMSTDCAAPKGFCDTGPKVCVQCLKSTDCAAPKAVCDTGPKVCVQCLQSTDCAAPKGVCDTGAQACVQCLGNTDCAAPNPVCDMPAKSCVQCLASADCGGKTPICEAKACRACNGDADCVAAGGTNPGVCMSDGHCASNAEVVYAVTPPVGTCGAADGTFAKPFCTAQAALDQAGTGTKTIVVLRGSFGGFSKTSTTSLLTVIGQQATINPLAGYGIDISGTANVTVRGVAIAGGTATASAAAHISGPAASLTLVSVQISGNAGPGVVAEGGGLIAMDRCVVKGAGGLAPPALKTTASPFHVVNSVFATSSTGASLDAVPTGGAQVFKNNTIIGNAFGVLCAGSFPSGLILFQNTTDTGPGCSSAACCSGDPKLTADFHLMSGSPCIDQLTFDPQVPDDLDGQTRPKGVSGKSDCGADEFAP